ncbi:hypothetical protein XSP_001084 [Xanthomonas euroxanthea]|uniref:Lipoprotein n=1 Tax=Xanthomonas euroxanthea TaxID=2259622 RepID=A0A8E4G4H5_9XANT|nr:hypothetical protein [Xanthomonas euroxanthea]CAD1788853.1 hypothetical protein XSP_001084 [Xanthomonas euroxanthea]
MKALLMTTVVLTLAGCASYSERQAEAPWFTMTSDRSAIELEQCVAPKLREIAPRITGAPDGDSVVYAVVADPAVLGTITLKPSTQGSIAEIRSVIKGGNFKKIRIALEECKSEYILLR